jgi:hypothetical protein
MTPKTPTPTETKTRKSKLWGLLCFVVGLALMTTYWVSVRPVAGNPGYAEDMCGIDEFRHLMADEMHDSGHPKFTTDHYMAPHGLSVPYLSWTAETDWLGGKIWEWDRNFPYQWAWVGFSLLISFLGVGYILCRMGLPPAAAWAVTTAVVVFHVPRHFKMWHHYEHLPEHWIYFSLFLDAWLWQRFWRDRTWSRKLELWRVVVGLGSLGSAGYFWGALILEWVLVRGTMATIAFMRRRRGVATQLEPLPMRSIALPFALIVTFCILWVQWFLPLSEEVKKGGTVWQGVGWWANFSYVVRPLWLEFFYTPQHTIDTTETVIAVGWFYWIPFLFSLALLRKKRGGPGWGAVSPFLIYLTIALLYACIDKPAIVVKVVQAVIPFMSFFRVASRWGLFLPQILTVIIVLSWPELTGAFRRTWNARRRRPWFAAGLTVFAVMSIAEATWLNWPVNMMPPMNSGAATMLEKIRTLPGTTVLDLPFCVAGGNGVCTQQQCPNYPVSVLGQCLRNFHDKNVYGLYAARLLFSDCEVYNRAPYTSWFQAWGQQRCFTGSEWDEFCGYLDQHTELSAILLYPEIWHGVKTQGCAAEFEKRLGTPLGVETMMTAPTRGGKGEHPSQVVWFAPKCRK